MHDETSSFLDRVSEESLISDRDRVAEGVRAVFYALLSSAGEEGAEECADLLPARLEMLWKPAYFQVLRDLGAPSAPPALRSDETEDPVEIVREQASPLSRETASRLLRAVAAALRADLDEGTWEQLNRRMPEGTRAALT